MEAASLVQKAAEWHRSRAGHCAANWRFACASLKRDHKQKNELDKTEKAIKSLQHTCHRVSHVLQHDIATPANTTAAVSDFAGEVFDAGKSIAGAIGNVTTYPVLTQEVAYAPSSSSAKACCPSAGFGQLTLQTINDVLGWKSKPDDPKSFVGALNSAFTCTEVDGRTECAWTPRTYAVATDLAGGITGAQASIYKRAKEAIDLALPLMEGLYPLDPTSDKEDVDALKKIARSQMTELVGELGMIGGPRPWRVSQYFALLLGQDFPMTSQTMVTHDPDKIEGTLGTLRDILGLNTASDFVNSMEDEADLTNFRIVADYITALAQSWINNVEFYSAPSQQTGRTFFGTQLVLLSRQLSVVAESVNEIRFAMDSVFIGPAERQTMELKLDVPGSDQTFSMYVEDILSWVATFATTEGPQLIQDGGKYATGLAFAQQASHLHELVKAALNPRNQVPHGYRTGRVQIAWQQLSLQLRRLHETAAGVSHQIEPASERISRVAVFRSRRTA
jgi:hypothetical protein